MVQWLRCCAFNAGGTGSSPDWGTKMMPHAAQCGQKKKNDKNEVIHQNYLRF